MSFLQHFFAPLLHGSANAAPPPMHITRFSSWVGMRDLHASARSSSLGSLVGFSVSTSRPDTPTTTETRSLVHVERFYGLGLLIAKAIGLRARLGLLSRPVCVGSVGSHPRTTVNSERSDALSSSYTPVLPFTPGQNPSPAKRRFQFPVRASPSNITWILPSPKPEERTQRLAPIDLHGMSDDRIPQHSRSPADFTSLRYVRQEDPLQDDDGGLRLSVYGTTADCSERQSQRRRESRQRSTTQESPVESDPDIESNRASTGGYPVPSGSLNTVPSEPLPLETYISYAPDPCIPSRSNQSLSDIPVPILTPSPFSSSTSSHPQDGDTFNVTAPVLALPPSVLYNPYSDKKDKDRYPDRVQFRGTTYQVLGMLGEGSFGRVVLALTHKAELVALKVVHKRYTYRTAGMKARLLIERDCMKLAAQNNIPVWVQLQAAWEDELNVFFAMDLCMGSLRSRMLRAHTSGTPISRKEMQLMCAEMLMALRYLREYQILHGDIKPDNFLISPSGRVLLCDFGLASTPDPPYDDLEEFDQWRWPSTGTPGYLAPEAMEWPGSGVGHKYITHKSDEYSLGLVFMELMSGKYNPVWDTGMRPLEFCEGENEWFRMRGADRQWWLMENVRYEYVNIPRDSTAWDLCMKMMNARQSVDLLTKHPYFEGLNFGLVHDGWNCHEDVPELRTLRVDKEKRDLTFEAFHRGRDSPDAYSAEDEFLPVVDEGRVLRSQWLVDNANIVQQMDGVPLLDFEWSAQS